MTAIILYPLAILLLVQAAPPTTSQADAAASTAVQPASAPPAPAASPAEEDLAEGLRLLEGIRDDVFSFDDPAFYWFCRYVRQQADPASFTIAETDTLLAWRFLMERPSDYRGRLVVVEGVLQSRPAFKLTGPRRSDLGTLTQCEITESGTRSIGTVITIDDAAGVPLRSRVRAKGYFIKVRAYRTNTGEIGAGPLIVARRLELLRPPAMGLGGGPLDGTSGTALLVAATACLAVLWLVLRRSLRLRSKAAPLSDLRFHDAGHQTDGDFDWLDEQPPRP